ncbi:hypothetical protein BDAP_001552 [Binucleata daphniae]
MNFVQKLKFFAKLTTFNIFIVPIISFLLTNTSLRLTKPAYTRYELKPTINKKSIEYKLNHKPKNRIFVTLELYETYNNMSRLNFNVKTSISNDLLCVSLRYKSNMYLKLDSIVMFWFIKLHLYKQTQTIKQEVTNILRSNKFEFVLPKVDMCKFIVEDVEDCSKFRLFLYKRDVLYSVFLFFSYFTILMLSAFYVLLILYKKCDTLSVTEVKEFVDDEISKNY